jgi:glycosyltransferase involved in cell wall biosynthesis
MDLVLSHILWPYSRSHGLPIIWSSQGISPSFYYDATSAFTQEDVVGLYNAFGNKASLLLIWTESGSKNVQNLCSLRTPIKVLPPITNFQPVDENSRKLQPKQAACQILFIGRDPSRKGLFDVLEAYQRLLAKGIDVAFDVVSRLTPAKERELRGIRGVTLYTDINNALVAELMERADVLVLPTYAETYGLVLIEAMARRCALVTSDYEPLNELVVGGENGLVVKPGDVGKITECLEHLATHPDLVIKLKENNLKKYRNEFSANVLIPRYLEVFTEVLRS